MALNEVVRVRQPAGGNGFPCRNFSKRDGCPNPWSLLVTGTAAGIGKALTGDGEELPVVRVRVQRQLQDAEGVIVGRLDIGRWGGEWIVVLTPRPHDELADAVLLIEAAIRILGSVAL